MVVNLLNIGGEVDSVSQYGILTGPVASIINMPIVLAMSISVAIVPAIASAMAGYDVISIKQKTATTVKMCLMIAMPFFLGGAIMAEKIVDLLYPSLNEEHRQLTAYLLSLMSVNIVLLSMLEVLNAILQGIGRGKTVLVNIAIGGAVKIILELLLVPRVGIVASGISSIAFYLISFCLSGAYYNELVGKNAKLFKSISKIASAGAIMSLSLLPSLFIRSNILALVCAVVVGGAVYVCALLTLKAIGEGEMKMLPLGGKLSKVLRRVGYYKGNS